MFDYQAGEKYRLTLVMVALAGLIAGIFFTVLLMPQPEAPSRRHRAMPAYMNDPDTNGGRGPAQYAPGAAQAAVTPATPQIDPNMAKNLIESWLPLAWDLSAGSAKANQEKAMAYMTPECAQAYRQNIWTDELAKQIDESGLKSSFAPSSVRVSDCQADGSVIVFVDGSQTLVAPAIGTQSRPVRLEYMIRQLPEGMRICGISEGGQAGSGT